MSDWIQLVGPQQVVEFMGIRLVGANADNAKELLFTLIFIGAVGLLAALLRRVSNTLARDPDPPDHCVGPGDRRAGLRVAQGRDRQTQ